MRVAEDVVYAVTALILVAGALAVLVDAGYSFATGATDNLRKSVEAALEALLVLFILVELLGAVRETISERKLVAEPFLLVGVMRRHQGERGGVQLRRQEERHPRRSIAFDAFTGKGPWTASSRGCDTLSSAPPGFGKPSIGPEYCGAHPGRSAPGRRSEDER